MNYRFLYHIKMTLARLKMITRGVQTTVSVTDQYGVNPDETWMYGEWFYMTDDGIYGHEVKATEGSPPDSLTRWIIRQSKGFSRKGIEKITRSVMAYAYLVLSSQAQARSTIVGNSAPAVDAQQLFKETSMSLINEDLSIDTETYQGMLEHALPKVDFFSRHRHIHVSKQFKLSHWKQGRIQQ